MGLTQYINTPTRSTPKRKSILDLYFTNCKHVHAYGVTNCNQSDHDQIYLRKKRAPQEVKKTTFKGRIYKNYDAISYKEKLTAKDWTSTLSQDDPNKAWIELFECLTHFLDEQCPVKDIKIRQVKEDWITTDHLEQITLKNDLMAASRKTNDKEVWIEAQRCRNQTKKMMKQAKSKFLTDALVNTQKDSKRFWRTLGKILPRKGNTSNPINLMDNTGQPVPPEDAATVINDFFTTVAEKLDVHKDTWTNEGKSTDTNFDVQLVNMTELKNEIRNINVLKSSGFDHLSSKVLKDAFEAIPHVLLHIMNSSIAMTSFPDEWKKATIVPIEKIPNAPAPSDFRPISLLPLPGKLLERMVSNQMMNYLEVNNLLSEGQEGYRKHRSTIKAVSTFTDDVFKEAGKNKITAAVFIDFSKAFDCVNHPILLDKLNNLGFSGRTVNWFRSYLTHRQQRTLANGTLSSYREISCGVPQGSILGPPLFIIFVNDMTKAVRTSKTNQYADDTVVYQSGTDPEEISRSLNEDLNRVNKWCKENKLHINCKKTKYLILGSPHNTNKCPDLNLTLDQYKLQKVTTFKYLGITLDQNLTFESHVNALLKTVRHKLFLLRTVRPNLTTFAALQIYRIMILPLLEYGNTIYGTVPAKYLKKLQTAQNSGLRAVFGLPKLTPTEVLHTKANIDKLDKRRDRACIIQAYNRTRDPKHLDKRNLRTRRHDALSLIVPASRTTLSQNAFAYRGATAWNDLPPEVRLERDRDKFKKKLDTHLGTKKKMKFPIINNPI